MNGGVEFNGMLGAFILVATPAIMAVVALISLIVYLAGRKSIESELNWSKFFFLSSIIFLVFDAVVLMFIFSQNKIAFSREEAVAFDKWMILGWIPVHLFGYFLVAFILRFRRVKKEPINKFIDKLR